MKLGKLPYRHDPRTLMLARYLDTTTLPTPPPALDLSAKVPSWPMYANDQLGDCTCAAAGHMIEIWSTIAGKEVVVSEKSVVAMYEAITGGVDSGAVELDVLKYWRSKGLSGDKILAFVRLDTRDRDHIRLSLQLFGGTYIGLALPKSAQGQVGTLWDVPATGTSGDGAPGSWGGHAVNVVGYDGDGLTVVTWGKLQKMSWRFWDTYCDEAWALLPTEWRHAQPVPGFNFAALQKDLAALAAQAAAAPAREPALTGAARSGASAATAEPEAPAADGGVPKTTVEAEAEAGGAGGDGNVTSFKDNGGRILHHPRVVLLYWGSAWGNAATTPSQTAFTNAIAGMLGGPWGTQLAQYRGIGPMTLEQVDVVTTSTPATVFTDPQIRTFIDGEITAGRVPSPSNAIDRIYCVIMPTGHSSGDTPFVGQHQFYDRSGQRVYWAWVTNDGTLTGGNSVTKILSHEVAEAVSDPDLGSGIIVNGNDEIGDVCNNTFSTINGAAEEAYWSEADLRCVLPRFAPFALADGNPVLIQGRFGTKGNFELVTPARGTGLLHFWRNNDNPYMPWSGAVQFGQNLGMVDNAAMIQSNYGSPGNLELIARTGRDLQFFWRDSGPAFHWNGPYFIETGVDGNPVLIQSRFGQKGNFEVVAPSTAGGLVHFWRNNDNPAMPWSGPTLFGQQLGGVDAVTMIQSNYGSPGNLEVVARVGRDLQFFWRDSGPAFHWNGPYFIATGAEGNPVLIQSRFGTKGNFEMVVPMASGGLAHFWRNNDNPAMPWSGPFAFGQGLGAVDAVTLIQSNYGVPGNLEVVARVGSSLYFFWRDSGPAFHWNGPFLLQSTVW